MGRTELEVFLVYFLLSIINLLESWFKIMIQIQALATSNYFSKLGVCICTTHDANPKDTRIRWARSLSLWHYSSTGVHVLCRVFRKVDLEYNDHFLNQEFWNLLWHQTGRPSVLRFMGSQRVGHDWATELNWTDGTGLSLVQFSHSVITDSLWCHGLQHSRPPCPSPTPGAYSNSCPSSRWSHPTILSSAIPFSSCPQSLQASGSFQMSQLFTSGGQSTGVSASASVLPMSIQDWSPLGWTGWISLQSKGLSRVFSNTIVQKHQFFSAQLSLQYNSHIHTWLLEKPKLWLDRPLLAK